eukprot:CAMPEP_0171138318 /NCGR_PEP_ID=MMETSP0766_2-20121228/134876_1 /TAXON_ID=439317 /ORGANISM="Gambierdiscus australes, Strain CAWD 149" /LENGTH=44 /DNA_ID= /DNA_START= /DNA_END= /DNA_ORIENTATION=
MEVQECDIRVPAEESELAVFKDQLAKVAVVLLRCHSMVGPVLRH